MIAVRLVTAALVSLQSPTYGRLWLSVTPHPGDTVSCGQADALVRAAEARTGTRPLRRTDLLAERIRDQQAEIEAAQRRLEQCRSQLNVARDKVQAATTEWHQALAAVAEIIERDGPPCQAPRPYSRWRSSDQGQGALATTAAPKSRADTGLARRWLDRLPRDTVSGSR